MIKYAIIEEISIKDGISIIKNDGNDKGLITLGEFLYDDMHNQYLYDYFTSWLQNNKEDQECVCGNANGLTKINGRVLVHSILPGDPEPDEHNEYVFITTPKALLEIIDDWLRATLLKIHPLNIRVEQDENDNVSFTWLGNPEEQSLDDFLESQKNKK